MGCRVGGCRQADNTHYCNVARHQDVLMDFDVLVPVNSKKENKNISR